MKQLIKGKLSGLKTVDEKYNFLREFLQELALQILDNHKYFSHLAFVGGTALRMLYDLPRFSEDLDFCLVNKADFDFNKMLDTLKKEFALNGFDIEVSKSKNKTVYSSFVKFKGILQELGLTRHSSEKLSIKLEIDSNPPEGYKTEIVLVNKNFLFKVLAYDLPSLFASKLHAFLFRKFAKGRDFYDLLWFLTRKTPINYKLLEAAARQTEKKEIVFDPQKLKDRLIAKIERADFVHIRREIGSFLINHKEVEYFHKEYFLGAVEKEFSA